MLTTTTLAEESPSPDVTGTDSAALLVDDNEEHNSLGGEPTNELPTQPGRILNEVLNRRAILFEEAQRRAAAMSRATVPIDRMLQERITAMSRATVPIDRMLQAQITAMGRATAPIDRMLQAQIRWAALPLRLTGCFRRRSDGRIHLRRHEKKGND